MGLADWFESTLAFLGAPGLLAAMFLIFLVDAALFPALPEVFIVLFYFELVGRWSWAPLVAGPGLLLLAVAGDVLGNAALYAIFNWLRNRGKVPHWLERIMRRWTGFLATGDERILLLNRIAPALPMTGAFIAVCGWSLRKSLAYIALGGAAKYAVLLLIVAGLGLAFNPEVARWTTIGAVLVLVGVSFVLGHIRSRRMRTRTEG